MTDSILWFLCYFVVAAALLVAFVAVYVRVTPYKDFALIAQGNAAAAVTLSGAVLGFAMPMAAAVYYTASIGEMTAWAGITGAVQLLVFTILRRMARSIEEGHIASAIVVATFSIAAGLLAAASISV